MINRSLKSKFISFHDFYVNYNKWIYLVLLLSSLSTIIILYLVYPVLNVDFFFDEVWRADLISSSNSFERSRTVNTPIPPLWIIFMKASNFFFSRIIPTTLDNYGFFSLRIQNLTYSILLPVLSGLFTFFIIGIKKPYQATISSVASCIVIAIVLGRNVASYLNDYVFQSVCVASLLITCYLYDKTGYGRKLAGIAIIIFPLSTLGGLVIMPAIWIWWIAKGNISELDNYMNGFYSNFLKRTLVPLTSAIVFLFLYFFVYRSQVDPDLINYWADSTLGNGTNNYVFQQIPISLGENALFLKPFIKSFNISGILIFAFSLLSLRTIKKAWTWLPIVIFSSWPIAILISFLTSWPAPFVRVNLPFVWLWYIAAIIGLGSIMEIFKKGFSNYIFLLIIISSLVTIPPKHGSSNKVFARGISQDINKITSSQNKRNFVISYHFMSHFYTNYVLKNITKNSNEFFILREIRGEENLYENINEEIINAGWEKGDAVWCIMPYELGSANVKRSCLINLPGLDKGYSERLNRSIIIGYFPE